MPEAEPQPRVALITGGSKGLGAGLVEAYLDAGYCVETCSRSSTDQVKAWESDPDLKERFHFAATSPRERRPIVSSRTRPNGGDESTSW
jgi:3-oxoacyl-[acyl-carrier protein] reductase